MNAELKQKWLEALRGGQYKQGKAALRKNTTDGRVHCCLGVLCDLVDSSKWMAGGLVDAYTNNWNTGMPPLSMLEKIGLNADLSGELAEMNDLGKSFAEIADHIEAKIA